jgi:peptidoglycan/LPS O-acetylase OafA/YrhL
LGQREAIPRLDFLDALRAIAALWVVHFHLIFIPQPNLARPQWAWLASLGGMGVTLFFVASSFSLCYTMPVHDEKAAGLGLSICAGFSASLRCST